MKKIFKHIALLMFMTALSTGLYAQLRVANYNSWTSASESSAFIDASSSPSYNGSTNIGKGLIYPRVDLTTFTFSYSGLLSGINYATRFDGMTVYNTATSGKAGAGLTQGTLSPGYWYYDNKSNNINGGTWKPVGNGIQAMTTVVRDSITTPYIGQTIYNITDSILNTYNGYRWITVGGGGSITFASGGQIDMKFSSSKGLYSTISAVGFGNSGDLIDTYYGNSINITGKNSGFAFDASQSGKVTAISATYTAAINEDFGGTLYVQLLEAKANSTIFTPMPGVNMAVGSFASVKSGMLMHNYVKGLNASITAGNRYMIIFYVKSNKSTAEDFEGWAGGSLTIQ